MEVQPVLEVWTFFGFVVCPNESLIAQPSANNGNMFMRVA